MGNGQPWPAPEISDRGNPDFQIVEEAGVGAEVVAEVGLLAQPVLGWEGRRSVSERRRHLDIIIFLDHVNKV